MSEAIAIIEAAASSRLAIRASDEALPAIDAVIGFSLPRSRLRATESGARAALNLGPGEWLLLLEETSAPELASELRRHVESPHSAVDISDRQRALVVSGDDCATVLNAACPLDLSLTAFPVRSSTRTIFGKAEIVLWRRNENIFQFEVWRSFYDYCRQILDLAKSDLERE